jgi:hypothetical protein
MSQRSERRDRREARLHCSVDVINWLRQYPDALKQARREGKPLFVDFWTEG